MDELAPVETTAPARDLTADGAIIFLFLILLILLVTWL